MQTTRREFLALTGATTAGLMAANLLRGANAPASSTAFARPNRRQAFNMCGYAAPKLERVRVGIVGLGSRGTSALPRHRVIEGLEIAALCDLRPERIAIAQKALEGTRHRPAVYTGKEDAWKEMMARDDLDLIYICTHGTCTRRWRSSRWSTASTRPRRFRRRRRSRSAGSSWKPPSARRSTA
jgi:hypothetical protein